MLLPPALLTDRSRAAGRTAGSESPFSACGEDPYERRRPFSRAGKRGLFAPVGRNFRSYAGSRSGPRPCSARGRGSGPAAFSRAGSRTRTNG